MDRGDGANNNMIQTCSSLYYGGITEGRGQSKTGGQVRRSAGSQGERAFEFVQQAKPRLIIC